MYIQQIPSKDIKQIVECGTYLASTNVSNTPDSSFWWYISASKVQANVLMIFAFEVNLTAAYFGILDHDDNNKLTWKRVTFTT